MKRLSLPIPAAALADCGAILGRRGAGKSGTGRVILEHELDAGHRCCVIDPKGDWWGIRADADGSPSRFEVPVFGGAHADVPISDDMGAALGQIVATSSTSCVIDLSAFSRAGMLRFMLGFAEALFMHNRQPLTLLVDEADQLAPQRVPAEVAKVLHFMEALIRQGRQRGIFMWMLTQRPAVINKNLLSQAETLIAMKMTGPQDRKAIRDWMDAHDPERAAEVEKDLAKLQVGQAWAWVPGADFLEKVQFPLYSSYDSGRTPKHGEIVGDVALKPIDVGEIAAALGGSTFDEADELADARAENARLLSRVEGLRRQVDDLSIEKRRLVRALADVQERVGMAIGSPMIVALPAEENPDRFEMLVDQDDVVRPFRRDRDPRAARDAAALHRMRTAPIPAADPAGAVHAALKAAQGLAHHPALAGMPPAMHRIVGAIVAAQGEPVPAETVAAIAGVSATSSNMVTKLKRLVEAGVVAQGDAGFSAPPELLRSAGVKA